MSSHAFSLWRSISFLSSSIVNFTAEFSSFFNSYFMKNWLVFLWSSFLVGICIAEFI